MVRETRHLWVGNLPDNIREDRIREHFKRYGRVQNVKLLGRTDNVTTAVVAGGTSGVCATVAFMDIKSASKAHNAEHVLDERTLTTEYYEPAAIPSATGAPSAGSSPAGSGYSGSSSSVNSTPAPTSVSRYHLSGGEDSSSNTCPIAASAAAPATWRGTNDSATEFCRRGNTPAAYGRYQRNNSTAPYSTPPSNVERTTPHHRWYAGDRVAGATGGESTPSTPGGGTEGGRRRRHSGSGSSRSDSSSPEPSDTSRASTPATQPLSHHNNHRTQPTLQHQWASTASGRPLAICVRNLPTRSTDSSLKDGLYHEYKKHGKVVWVKVVGQNADRYAVVRFKKPSDVEKALEVSQDKLFFGCKISVAPHQSCDEDADSAKPYETDIDEYHPKATRTLFIGNLEKDVTQQQLRDKFKHFGRIIEIDIKKGSSGGAGYAFCQYASISSVVEAIRAMDGEYVGGSRVKLGFGKPVATTCVWVDGLAEHTEKQVLSAVSRCGGATSVCVDRAAGAALVHFEQAAAAGAAVRELRRVAAAVSATEPDHPRLCVDYASRECQEAFYEQLEKHGGTAALTGSERLTGDLATTRYMPSTRHEPIRYDTCTSRSRASSYGRSSSRTPRYSTLDHYDPTDYAADRRYRVYDEVGSSPQPEDTAYEERLQSVVVSPHRARRHRRDSSPEDRKHSKERHRSAGARRSRSGSRGGERHGLRRKHRRRRDGSGSHSRAGTPLRDELDAPPTEPRRIPRERPPLPMSLPLPKFAVQLLRTVPPAPRPAPAPAPDSPPRPPSISSSSGGSAPHSPSLEERIRSLDEKLNGSRNLTDAPDRTRLRHRLLEIDINEVKPSEVVRSLLAKRSVFDEDSERLEGATRVPSPVGSPRASSQPCTPRALRYPFPAHPPPPPPPSTPPDEPRACPRTPDIIEHEQSDVQSNFEQENNAKPCDRRTVEDFTGLMENVNSIVTDVKKKNIDEETVSHDKIGNYFNNSINIRTQIECTENKLPTNITVDRDEVFRPNDRRFDPLVFQAEDSTARDVMDMLLKQVENYEAQKHEFDAQLDKKIKTFKDREIKSEFTKQEHRVNTNSESKFDLFSQTDSKDTIENNIAKELSEYEMQENHINSMFKSDLVINQNILNDPANTLKDKHSYHPVKIEKENIIFDKTFLKEKFTLPLVKKTPDGDKHHDERSRTDRDKLKPSREKIEKDKHEYDKEKPKNKFDKHVDKDKKLKEDIEKVHSDKVDKIKIERDTEKIIKDKIDKDVDKTKHIEEKPTKYESHKKDKNEKDKRIDLLDIDLLIHKTKKDDKHKYERVKKDNDFKKEMKKESESIKHRKSSRDESTRELCRKDSTDSSTSRTSHDSTKVKEIDNNDNKDETKLKSRHSHSFPKHENDKNFISTVIKTDIKDEKDPVAYIKNKVDTIQEQNLKSKSDITEKQRHYSLDSPSVDTKRKERLSSCSSLPSNIGHKRRMSSQDSLDSFNDDTKKCRNDAKISDRRDSKDSRTEIRHKTTKFSKGHFAKIIESKTKDDKKNQVKPPDDTYTEGKENERSDYKDLKNNDKTKSLKKSPKDEVDVKYNVDTPSEGLRNDLDFLATLELRSSEEDERQRALRKEMKEKKRIQQLQQIQELQMQQDAFQQGEFIGKIKDDKKQKCDDKKKETAREKRMSTDRKSRDEKIEHNKRKNRKLVHSSDSSDSDEPKKHSIFDIIDDGPTYISMYDKVKARSCKNMQKQEEEKRQEKIKAKFSQLKQSRAKREEKKRSSWDEDSDSDVDRKKHQKSSIDNSSEDDNMVLHTKKRDKMHVLDYEHTKMDEFFDVSTNDEDPRNKLSRKNSRTRIMSDSSDDEISKRSLSKSPNFLDNIKKELHSDLESMQILKNNVIKDVENNGKKSSILNLFGKSDSDDSKMKLGIGNDNGFKSNFVKAMSHDFSSENESISNKMAGEICRKHKKRQRKHKSAYSDEDIKVDTSELDGEIKLKNDKQQRHNNKKEKRKDKLRDSVETDETRDEKNKLKKERKLLINSFDITSENIVSTIKKEGKMEDIFGPLSDESDRETRAELTQKTEYCSNDVESVFSMNNTEFKLKEKDDNRRKKEKKRREKRHFKEDENSLDVDAVSKAIEARLFADVFDDDNSRVKGDTLSESLNKIHHNELKFIEANIINEIVKHDKLKKECKERRKKKKKSREDRQSRKDHSYYHEDKNDKTDLHDPRVKEIVEIPAKTMLLDIPLPSDEVALNHIAKMEDHSLNHSLPRLTDSPPIVIQSDETTDSSTINTNNIVIGDDKINNIDSKEIEVEEIPMPPPYKTVLTTDVSDVPLPKQPIPIKLKPNQDDFISSFNSDDDLCKDAVRNITNSEKDMDVFEKSSESDISACKMEKKTEEKPRAIISQEETEDAVAALLGESFGGKANDFSSYDESENDSTREIQIESTTIDNGNIPEEDAEEMRQAVQNLNASEMEIKPDTPVSDNDLLLIDTDTEEADEAAQDAIEKLPVNIIATNQATNPVCEPNRTSNISNIAITQTKPNLIQNVSTDIATAESKNKDIIREGDVKIHLMKRENPVQLITSSATPVITSWTLSNQKLLKNPVLNIESNVVSNREKDTKSTHVAGNIQIDAPQPPNMDIHNSTRPLMTSTRVNTSYQVINQIIRPQATNVQPPTIKIPEPHILYQKPQSIVISPRMSNDPRVQSPKANPQNEGMTSPRLTNVAILSSSPQSLSSVGIVSPNAVQQRSPGQMKVVRMQQPPLSPIQAVHMPHGARAMLSPNRPNSVLVQGTPIFNRLPVTPVLAPISKQMTVNNLIPQNKAIPVSPSTILHQQKKLSVDCKKTEPRNLLENSTDSKIILSPANIQHNSNSTTMIQNRLISMQNAMHVGNINSPVHLNNKVLINSVSQLNDKKDNQIQRSEQISNISFGSTPIIHMTGVNNAAAAASIIQTGTKTVTCNLPESVKINRSQNSNVIQSLNSQRILNQVPLNNILELETNKVPVSTKGPSVFSMTTIRPPFITKLELSTSPSISTTSISNVSSILSGPSIPVRLSPKVDKVDIEPQPSVLLQNTILDSEPKGIEKIDVNTLVINVPDAKEEKDVVPKQSSVLNIAKCETDFEELLKDNTNEIKITNDPEKKLEVNIGKNITLLTSTNQNSVENNSIECSKAETNITIDSFKTQSQFHSIKEEKDVKNNNSTQLCVTDNMHSNLDNTQMESSSKKDNIKDAGINSKDAENGLKEIENVSKLDTVDKDEECNFLILSSDISECNDHQLKNDDGDSWSAKDVNIESVIKKVDSLCNENVESIQKFEEKNHEVIDNEKDDLKIENNFASTPHIKQAPVNAQVENDVDSVSEILVSDKILQNVNIKRGGRNIRGKKNDRNIDRVQTRQISKPSRGATTSKRGRGRARVDKKIKSLVNSNASAMPGDVYDFHEDSGDEATTSPNKTEARPRLILTIKSPLSGHSNMIATSTLSIATKDHMKVTHDRNKEEKNEEFISPSPNTRKSRRLQEKDVQRNTVDDVIEDVIKGPGKINKESNKKKPTRHTGIKFSQDKAGIDTRKSPRGVKRTRDRTMSDASIDSGDERLAKEGAKDPKAPRLDEQIAHDSEPSPSPRSAPMSQVLPPTPTPITKPPKKMISEISAKLACAFEAAVATGVGERILPETSTLVEPPLLPVSSVQGGGEAALVRRLGDAVPGALVPVGATEATDVRVQSPALPHRPPSVPCMASMHRAADRATPVLIRGVRARSPAAAAAAAQEDGMQPSGGRGEGEVAHAVGAGAGAVPLRPFRAYAATASLPRGAHHPPHPPIDHHLAKQVAVTGSQSQPHHPGAASRVTIASVPSISPQSQMPMGDGIYPHFSHQHYQMYQQHFRATQHENRATPSPYTRSLEAEGSEAPTPALELRRPPSTARVSVRGALSPAAEQVYRGGEPEPPDAYRRGGEGVVRRAPVAVYAVNCGRSPPPAHAAARLTGALPPGAAPGAPPGPPHASQVPREADSLQMLLRRYPVMWQGLLALKNDSAAVQMHFVGGNPGVAGDTLTRHADGTTPLLRIAQRMRLEPVQLDQVHRKMKMETEHCMLLALPCGRDHMDVLQQSNNLNAGFIQYLQRKQAAGIVNVAPPGHHQAMYTVHIFPSCDFANENLNRIAPDLMHRVANIAHLLIVIATV